MTEKRKIVASGSIKIKDDELIDDEFGRLKFTVEGVVSRDQPSVSIATKSKCVGGEVRFELELDAGYLDSGDVRITGEARLYEGVIDSTTELEDTQDIDLIVPKDSTARKDIRVESTGIGGGDWAKGSISFTNTGLADK